MSKKLELGIAVLAITLSAFGCGDDSPKNTTCTGATCIDSGDAGASHDMTTSPTGDDAGTFDMSTSADMDRPTDMETLDLGNAGDDVGGMDMPIPCTDRPTAVLKAAVEKSTQLHDTTLASGVFQLVELSASESIAASGGELTYAFDLVSAPAGATATLLAGSDDASRTIRPDVQGLYQVELSVTDSNGVEACAPSKLDIQVGAAGPGLTIELTWVTPGVNDPNAINDLDIHYRLEGSGTWDTPPDTLFPYGVSNGDYSLDWGAPGPENDPVISVFTNKPGGAEIVHHPEPEAREYDIGVYYRQASSSGPSYATLRVYVDGQLQFELEDTYMATRQTFWWVCNYDHATKTFGSRHQIYRGFP